MDDWSFIACCIRRLHTSLSLERVLTYHHHHKEANVQHQLLDGEATPTTFVSSSKLLPLKSSHDTTTYIPIPPLPSSLSIPHSLNIKKITTVPSLPKRYLMLLLLPLTPQQSPPMIPAEPTMKIRSMTIASTVRNVNFISFWSTATCLNWIRKKCILNQSPAECFCI